KKREEEAFNPLSPGPPTSPPSPLQTAPLPSPDLLPATATSGRSSPFLSHGFFLSLGELSLSRFVLQKS
ncbi:hypothetical protein A2U01_0101282, partial [Trifolium medium]|nr:hypothetical protein [Trifolium medium]